MTGDQLKRWRENRALSQADLADLLGEDWSRDRIANLESDRTTMAENIETKLALIDESLQRNGTDQAKEAAKAKWDYSKHKCWSLNGTPITMAEVERRSAGYQFYRQDNSKDVWPETDHPMANLYEKTRNKPNGADSFFKLDLYTWEVLLVGYKDHPKHPGLLEQLNELMADRRNALKRATTQAEASNGMFQVDPMGGHPLDDPNKPFVPLNPLAPKTGV